MEMTIYMGWIEIQTENADICLYWIENIIYIYIGVWNELKSNWDTYINMYELENRDTAVYVRIKLKSIQELSYIYDLN